MTPRIAAARQSVPGRRALLLAGVLSALLAGTLARVLSQSSPAAQIGGHAGATASTPSELAALSPAARASISAALGADYPAYHFTAVGSGFQATNKAQQFVVTADGDGVSVRAHRLALDLHLQAIGYGSSLRAVDRPPPRSTANRVSYTHAGGVSEWYANGPLGLEQGFTVARQPVSGAAGPLTLAIALAGDARASLAPGGQSVEFTVPGGGSVSYTGLAVTDAGGRALHGTLALASGRLLLRVEARHARFPLRIDPTVTELAAPEVTEQTLAPTADERQHAGVSVALSADGNTALVGGPRGDGTGGGVWVFEREANTQLFTQTAELTPSTEEEEAPECAEHIGGEPVERCSFGSAVALSANGATALVGDPHESVEGPSRRGNKTFEHAGAVYVFTRSEGQHGQVTWPKAAELKSPKPSTHGSFGYSVALSEDGETALIGAPGEELGGGRAWMFSGSGASWQVGDVLEGTHEENKARFGRSVALAGDGDVAVVGAPNEEEEGAVWVFEGSPAEGFPLAGTKVVSPERQAGSQFGASVAVSREGDTALVGAPRFDASEAEQATGAVWAFVRNGLAWTQMGAKLTGPGEPTEHFGASVALSPDGQTALVGAPRALEGHGDAWLYEHMSAGSGAAERQLRAGDEQDRAAFGESVASSAQAKTLLLGAPDDDRHEGAGFIVGRGPAVTHLMPAAGSPYGGTEVTIEGQHLAGAMAVKFGDAPAESFEEKSADVIVAVAPPGAGKVDVTVQTPAGTSEGPNHNDEFTYEPPIYSVKPGAGPPAGGTEVTIRGDYFSTATAVYFGNTAAMSMKVESEEVIKAVSPPEDVGTVHITVQAPFGESAATEADVFVYAKGTESAGGRNEGGPPGNPPNNPPSGKEEPSGSAPASSGGVLGAGPLGTATCRASLLASRIFVERSGLAVLEFVGKGTGSCRGELRLRVRVKRKGHRSTLQTIGTAVFTITAGRRVSVKVTLTRAGRALLAAGHGRLNANLLIVRSSPAPALAQTAAVHLAPQPKQAKPRHET